jgi:hypothetical protein
MPDQSVSRRIVVGALATSVVGAKVASVISRSEADLDLTEALANGEPLPLERHLLAPLAEGARLLSWEIVAIEPLTMGAVRVQLRGESGVAFGIEVLARDGSAFAQRPPAETEQFAIYVNNGGDGRMPTVEEQGLAAMALSQIVARNELHVSTEGFLTHRDRIAEHPVALLRHVDGSALPGPSNPATARA